MLFHLFKSSVVYHGKKILNKSQDKNVLQIYVIMEYAEAEELHLLVHANLGTKLSAVLVLSSAL